MPLRSPPQAPNFWRFWRFHDQKLISFQRMYFSSSPQSFVPLPQTPYGLLFTSACTWPSWQAQQMIHTHIGLWFARGVQQRHTKGLQSVCKVCHAGLTPSNLHNSFSSPFLMCSISRACFQTAVVGYGALHLDVRPRARYRNCRDTLGSSHA